MLTEEQVRDLIEQGLLAEVVGFETDEIACSAEGASVMTYHGRKLLDFTGGIAVHACGHNHPEVVAAIRNQAGQVLHVSDTMRHFPQLQLAQWLRDLFAQVAPGAPWTTLFKNSGSEAIEAAAKLALKATGRSKLVAFEGAFHGRTLVATALSRSKRIHWNAYEPFLAPLRSNIHHAPPARCADCPAASRLERCSGTCIDPLEELLDRIGADVAAVFLEAQQGEGGYIPMPPAAARRIRALTRKHGILLVADEIQCAWGRTGRWFGFEHLGIVPDIVVFGKAVGGGLPLAGLSASRELLDLWEPGEHGTTFGGNPVACAAGLAALHIIAREGLVERADCLGQKVRARLGQLVGHYGVHDVRGHGLMIGIELRNSSGAPDYARCEAVKKHARENSLIFLTCGAKIGKPEIDNATIRLIPPLNISEAQLQEGLEILEAALQAIPTH